MSSPTSKSTQQTTTTNNVLQTDDRVGVSGEGNVAAGQNSQLTAINQDLTPDVVQLVVSGQGRALDTVDRSLSLADNTTQATLDTARQVVLANNDLSEKTREGNQELAKYFLDKSSTALADQRQGADEAIINNVVKSGSYVAIALAVTVGLGLVSRKK